jgi:hypothetical protein
MTRTLIATALAIAVVTPALAQTVEPQPYEPTFQARQSRGQAPTSQQRRAPNPDYDVYNSGQYIGSDPDPIIRNRIAQDPPNRF